ncbi:hypothetical protein BD310DRAFT_872506 [Dichomitus squalens]|uniref:Uncharacterized protein n=1 Tax=Dichomitus squalens TaxID=114155 RepID=A0A4Q9Q4D8_9APHY|nr:hypothetical protein BD310DRAFT_872506 [Dichomitus squalens]
MIHRDVNLAWTVCRIYLHVRLLRAYVFNAVDMHSPRQIQEGALPWTLRIITPDEYSSSVPCKARGSRRAQMIEARKAGNSLGTSRWSRLSGFYPLPQFFPSTRRGRERSLSGLPVQRVTD